MNAEVTAESHSQVIYSFNKHLLSTDDMPGIGMQG